MLPNVARFEPDMSVGTENDTFTVLNLAVVVSKERKHGGNRGVIVRTTETATR